LGQEEEVEATELEEDLDVAGYKDASDGGRQDSTNEEDKEEEGHDDGAGVYDEEGVGVTGLLQDPHPHADLVVATLFALL
jgi:hypothetical protein